MLLCFIFLNKKHLSVPINLVYYFLSLTLKSEVVAAGFSSMLMLLGSMMRPKLWRLHACGICMVGEGTLSTATVQSMLLALTVAVAGSVSGIV